MAVWVRWDASGTAVPYGAEDGAVLEALWRRGGRRARAVLCGRGVTVDLRRMELCHPDGTAMPLTRSAVTPSVRCLLGPDSLGAEEAVRLLPLAEGSDEFANAVRRFYGSLWELRGHIRVLRAQQLIHPRLYGQFRRRCAELERRGDGAWTEQLLFHGTTAPRGLAICLHGFRAPPGCPGVPLAVSAAVALRRFHSPPSPDGTQCVLVVRALCGRERPPNRPGEPRNARRRAVRFCCPTAAYPLYVLSCVRVPEERDRLRARAR